MRELARSFRTEARRPSDKGKTRSGDERNEEEEERGEKIRSRSRARRETFSTGVCFARERETSPRDIFSFVHISRAYIHACINIDGRRVYASSSSSSSSVRAQQTRSSPVVIARGFRVYCDLAATPRVSTPRFPVFPALPPH